MKNRIFNILSAFLFLVCGCAAQSTWTSDPIRQTRGGEGYDVMLEPLKLGKPYFAGLKITVKNNSDTDLIIDWNKTKYVHDGKARGRFLFTGIDPERFKNKTVPPDIVSPHSIFAKEIFPASTVALTPLRETTPTNTSSINAGMLPTGENGVLLMLTQHGREIQQLIAVRLIEEKSK